MHCTDLSAYLDRVLSGDEQHELEDHAASCESCQAELQTWRSIESAIVAHEDDWEPTTIDAQRVVALARERIERGRRSWLADVRVWIGAVVATAAAALIVIGISPSDDDVHTVGGPIAVVEPQPAAPDVTPVPDVTPEPAVKTGAATDVARPTAAPLQMVVLHGARNGAAKPRPAAVGTRLEAPKSDRLVVRVGDDKLVVAKRGRAQVVEASAKKTRIRLLRGTMVFDVKKRTRDEVFEVEAGDYLVTVVGTLFAVTVWAESGVDVEVEEGRVKVDGPDLLTTFVSAGQSIKFGGNAKATTPKPRPVDPTKSELARMLELAEESGRNTHTKQAPKRDPRFKTWRTWIDARNYDAVELSAEDHLKTRPGDYEAWWILAQARRGSGRWARAVEAYKKVIRLAPPTRANQARMDCSEILQDHLNEHDEAAKMLGVYLKQKPSVRPDSPQAMIRLAKSWRRIGKAAQAMELLRTVMIEHQGRPEATEARYLLSLWSR